jgi:hypothetical protein
MPTDVHYQEIVHQNRHPQNPGSGPPPRSLTGEQDLSDVICKKDGTDILSFVPFSQQHA